MPSPRRSLALSLLSGLAVLAAGPLRAQAPPPFVHLTTADGLVHDGVNAILQDRQGFLWFGTGDGLARYDGVRLTSFRHVPGDGTSLLQDRVLALLEDRSGALWVASNGGLSRFDPRTERFRTFPVQPARSAGTVVPTDLYQDPRGTVWVTTWEDGLLAFDPATGRYRQAIPPHAARPDAPAGSAMHALHAQADGVLWITSRDGLIRFDPRTGAHRVFRHDPADRASLSATRVWGLAPDGRGGLWVGTAVGLDRFDPATGRAVRFRALPTRAPDPVTDAVRAILVAPGGLLWLGTSGGVARFDPASGAFTTYTHDPDNPASVGAGRVDAVYEDRTGVLWIGTERGGVSRFDQIARRIARVTRMPDGQPAGLTKAFLEDRAGRLWFGGEGGLVRFDPSTQGIRRFTVEDDGLPGANVNVLLEDTRGTVWVGTEGAGLGRLRRGAARFERLPAGRPGEHFVYALLEDAAGILWVGTNDGLRRHDPASGRWTAYRPDPADPRALGDPWVTALLEDRHGALWIGTGAGLDRLDRDRGVFTRFRHTPADRASLRPGTVLGLEQGHDGTLWVLTDGLNRFDPRTGRAEQISPGGPPGTGRLRYGLLEDEAGHLWLNTNDGLVRYAPSLRRAWRRYDAGRVTMPTDQALGARLRTRDGRLFFGAQDGYLVLQPRTLRANPHPPRVVLTDVEVDEHPVRPGPEAPLRVAAPFADVVRLRHDDQRVTFAFAALHFSDPARNTYVYRLEGFDARWRPPTHETRATFTNLPAGRYTFRVRAANADGVWGAAGASVSVVVAPPWWGTWWFRLLAALTAAGALLGVLRLRVRALARRTHVLEGEVARRTAEIERQRSQLADQAARLMELDGAKSRFFANISHEFRTPLTLIQGYLEGAETGRPSDGIPDRGERLRVALDQTRRLTKLVEELLDLTRLQANRLRLNPAPGDLCAFARRVTGSLTSLADRRRVALTVETPTAPLAATFDPDRLEQVLTNLIGNALTFTPPGGRVRVRVFRAETAGGPEASLEVTDTGPGVAADVLPRLFERFYQADDSPTRSHNGLGIGLALVKELVELHGGRVAAESVPGIGSTFFVHLPATGPVAPADGAAVWSAPGAGRPPRPSRAEGALVSPAADAPAGHVLVAEDHPDLRAFLREHLAPPYRVTVAENGHDAWDRLQRDPPDLVLSDIMMPELDGLALLDRIKRDPRLRTIPVLLLTARSDPEDRLAGLEAAADGYLAKPFSVAELRAQVRNLIGLRRAIAQQSGRQVVAVQPEEMPLEDAGAAFVRRVQAVLADHLGEADFNVLDLAAALFMSERTLRRQIKEVTGFSASAYIRHVRLLHAKALIDRRAYRTTSEVAHAVGFRNVSYFTKRYAETFGRPPP